MENKEVEKIPLSSPDLTDLDKKKVLEVLNSPFLSRGEKIKEFEQKISEYIGVPYAIAVNSGTSALHLCVKSLGLKEGDEVITTPFSFIASTNCLLMEKVKPVFVDIDPLTYNINPDLIEEKINSKTKAILPVDIFGHPVDIDRINQIAKKHNLYVIEDACEALGSEYKSEKVGRKVNLATFAFYPNKQITTGEGGIIVTSNEHLARLCRSMRNHGSGDSGEWGIYERVGYNYWMDEMSAALGSSQMDRIDEILERRTLVADKYKQRLKSLVDITLPYEDNSSNNKISWFIYPIRVKENKREDIIKFLQNYGIDSRAYFSPIPLHLQKHIKQEFGYKEGDFPVAEKVSKEIIALPFYNNLKDEQVNYVAEKLREALKN